MFRWALRIISVSCLLWQTGYATASQEFPREIQTEQPITRKAMSNLNQADIKLLIGLGGVSLFTILGSTIRSTVITSDENPRYHCEHIGPQDTGSTIGLCWTGKTLDNIEWHKMFATLMLRLPVIPIFSSLFASISYALSEHLQPTNSQALVRIEDGKPQIGIPLPKLRPYLLSRDRLTWKYKIRLVSARF